MGYLGHTPEQLDVENRTESQFWLCLSCAIGAKAHSWAGCALHNSKGSPIPPYTRPGVPFRAHTCTSQPHLLCAEDKESVTLFSFLPAYLTPLSKSNRKAPSSRRWRSAQHAAQQTENQGA